MKGGYMKARADNGVTGKRGEKIEMGKKKLF